MVAPAHNQPAAAPPRWFPWLDVLVVLGVLATVVVAGAVLLQSYLIAMVAAAARSPSPS
jgi:hypothetical protein